MADDMMAKPNLTDETEVDRRGFLRTGAAALAAVTFAGCGNESETTTSNGSGTEQKPALSVQAYYDAGAGVFLIPGKESRGVEAQIEMGKAMAKF